MRWEQGEHLALIGRTGTGKTTVLEALGSSRKYCVIFRTKQDTLAWRKFRPITKASQMDSIREDREGALRLILQPPAEQRAIEFRAAIKRAYKQGGWTVGFDELYEMQMLGLEPDIIQLYSEGRSERVTCIGGMQRPSWVTRNGVSRWAISQPTHLFCFQTDEVERDTLAKILGRRFANELAALRRYEFRYRNQVTGDETIGSLKTLGEVFNGLGGNRQSPVAMARAQGH